MTHYVCKGFWPNTCFSFVLILLHTVLFSPGCVCVCVEELPGDGPLQEESYAGKFKGANPNLLLCSRWNRKSTDRALQNNLQYVIDGHVSDQSFKNTPWREHEGHPLACAHSSAPCNTKSGRTATGTLLSSHINACSHWAHVTNVKENIIQHEFGSRSLMCWGGISLEGQTDLHMLANSTMITHKLVEILRRHHQTLCWCSGSRFPPEGQCS